MNSLTSRLRRLNLSTGDSKGEEREEEVVE